MRLRIKDLREDNDLKQEDIAKMLNCSQATYCRSEKGVHAIPAEALVKLADFYDVSLDYLMGRSDEMK